MGPRRTKDTGLLALWFSLSAFALGLLIIVASERSHSAQTSRLQAVDGSQYHPLAAAGAGWAGHSACERVTEDAISHVRASGQFSVFTFADGALVETPLVAPASVCIIAAVPQQSSDIYTDTPIYGRGPDDIHLFVNSSTEAITSRSLLPRNHTERGFQEQFHNGVLLYQQEVSIKHAGLYAISAEQEWANWRWARQFEIFNDSVKVPTDLQIKFSSNHAQNEFLNSPLAQETIPAYWIQPPTLTIQSPFLETQDTRPICTDTLSASTGRWLVNAHTTNPWTRDEWGWTWEPDTCRLEHYSDEDILDCLADANIHMYGNSNLRRIAKTLLSGGRWCTDIAADCQNNDSAERDILTLALNASRITQTFLHLSNKWTFTDEPPVHLNFGRNATLHFSFLRALSEFPRDWVRIFFTDTFFSRHPRDIHGPFTPDTILPGARPRLPPDMRNASNPHLVIVGFAAWDAAFDSSLASLQQALPIFRDTLLAVFPTSHIVLRLSNSLCCKKDWGYFKQRYTAQRINYINALIRGVFAGGRISILDPSLMAGRPEVAGDFGEVYTNHPRVSHVRIETQMLLAGVCERVDGGVRLRRVGGLEGRVEGGVQEMGEEEEGLPEGLAPN